MNRYKDMTISDIRVLLSDASYEQYPNLLYELAEDERLGVKKIVLQYNKKYQKHVLELKRIANLKRIEETLYEEGYGIIAGTDEVGRGPLCGPVVSAVVIMPRESSIPYINDSKQLSEKKREELYDQIMSEAISVGIGIVEHDVIDKINILNATKLSMRKALDDLSIKPDLLLLDALKIDADIRQKSFIKGDETVYTIAAASIIAKVTRDRMMVQYHDAYPQYHFNSNKGYGSAQHIEAIKTYGPVRSTDDPSFRTICKIIRKKQAIDLKRSLGVIYNKKDMCWSSVDIDEREERSILFVVTAKIMCFAK